LDLCSLKDVLPLMERHGFRFSKALGQNFLTDARVPVRIAEASGAASGYGVLEIGPGVGCMTRELALRAEKVVSVELDSRLIPVLAETLADHENVKVVNADIMKTDIFRLVEEEMQNLTPIVCANLPYNITTSVITKLAETGLFETITVMIQKEAAIRLCAGPGDADYCAFSVLMQYLTKPEILFDVPAGCFTPQPKVTSAVVRMEKRNVPVIEVKDERLFFRVVNGAFAQRRKTLRNSLASVLSGVSKEQLDGAMALCGIDPACRGETLGIPEFAALANALGERK